MSIVKMKRLTLLAMNVDKESIFSTLVKSNAVQLKRTQDIASCTTVATSTECEKLYEKISKIEETISFLTQSAQIFNEQKGVKTANKVQLPKNSFAHPLTEVDYDYFLHFDHHAKELEQTLQQISSLRANTEELIAQKASKLALQSQLQQYVKLPHPTSWYADTQSSFVRLCNLPSSQLDGLQKLASQYDMVQLQVVDDSQNTAIVVVVAHKSQGEFFEQASLYGLVRCSFTCDVVPQLALKDVTNQVLLLQRQIEQNDNKVASYAPVVAQLKIYVDYLGLSIAKLSAESDLQNTEKTFVLEGYYPAEQEQKVQQLLQSVSNNLVLTFDDIGEDEFAPTLLKNSKVVKPFEFVTNMYTSPDYHEIDPNPVMSLFYFLIFGLMVADMGYGLVLLLAGVLATFAIKQNTAIRTVLQLFGICGVGAIGVGALFGSFFSYSVFNGVIPDPAKYPMVMMILSLFAGILHIMAGIVCKMAVKYKRKQKLSAWLCDFPWLIVFASFVLVVFNPALDMAGYQPYMSFKLGALTCDVALYVCLGSLAFALVFAGFGQKGLVGKVAKTFGSAYGLINYFSDVMSYIRIFGLMLSSALMGIVINQLGDMVLANGAIGYVFAPILLIFAHVFNLAMGILGVYIHDGRLQYVEFFGKFYTGDGALFAPFGNSFKYTLLRD